MPQNLAAMPELIVPQFEKTVGNTVSIKQFHSKCFNLAKIHKNNYLCRIRNGTQPHKNTTTMTASTKRYTALDVLRGMTVAGMILVNNPGTWSHIFPPLRHAAWNGCTPTDLVFPFFLFVVGAAMAFSFAKFTNGLDGKSTLKILKRGLLIFLVGLGLNAFPFVPVPWDSSLSFTENIAGYYSHLRIFGVLQRIALCYIIGGILALGLQSVKKTAIAGAGLMLVHWIILLAFGGGDPYSLENNISGKIDLALLGENHVYKGFGIPFDPEGLLGAISGTATVLFGYIAGMTIRSCGTKIEAVAKLYTTGLISLGAGCIWSIWLPINKGLWTGSYVLYAGGWTVLMLAFFIYLIDIKGKEKLFTPFKALGLNPLFAFVMAGLFAKTFGRIIRWTTETAGPDGTLTEKTVSLSGWFYQNCCVSVFGDNEYASLMYALVYVAIFTAMAMVLYKKKIIIKL